MIAGEDELERGLVAEFYQRGFGEELPESTAVVPPSTTEGMEAYLAEGRIADRKRESYHLLLLAENETGYRNLLELTTRSWLEGYYYKPRIDRELLQEHHNGLIALSACAGGVVSAHLVNEDLEAAREAAEAGRDVPLMISMTITDLAGRNLSGHTVEAFWHAVRHARPVTIGLNCSFGAKQLRPHVQALSATADTLIMVYPNAGHAFFNDRNPKAYNEAAATDAWNRSLAFLDRHLN